LEGFGTPKEERFLVLIGASGHHSQLRKRLMQKID
jgi:hypothetical protein